MSARRPTLGPSAMDMLAALQLEELRSLVDEAAEVVVEVEVTGSAGSRWRADWLKRARVAGIRLMGGAS